MIPKTQSLRRSLRFTTLAWVFGSVWFTATSGAPLAVFAKSLNASRFDFGILTALPYLGALLALTGTLLTERMGRRRFLFMIGIYIQRLLWIPIGFVPVWILHRGGTTQLAMWAFLLLIFVMNAAGAIGGVPWMSWMADLVPSRVRGKYFSRRRQWGLVTAIPTAIFAGWLLDHYIPPNDSSMALKVCALLFICSTAFGVADVATFHLVPDIYKPPQRGDDFLRALIEPLHNRSFLWTCGFVAVMTFALAFMNQFVTLYLIEQVGATNAQTQIMVLIAPSIAQLLVLPVWGAACDRMGKKPLLILAGIGMVLPGLGWSLTTSSNIWFGYLVASVGAALWTGIDLTNFNLVVELSGTDGEPEGGGSSSYVAVNAVVTNLAGFLGGIASGIIAQMLGERQWHTPIKTLGYFDTLFIISAGLRLLAVVVFLPNIHEPTARTSVEALRFMSSNVYNNLMGIALQPMRIIRRRQGRQDK